MNQYEAKASAERDYSRGAAGDTLGETRRDTARVMDALQQCHAAAGQIEESISIARNALWGPMPMPPDNAKNIKAVEPSGFLPAALASLTALLRRLEELNASSRNLRNL